MVRFGHVLSLLAILSLACASLSAPAPKTATPASTLHVEELPELPNSALVDVYDPSRNPAEDLKWAVILAQRENKRIMLELGGDWCIWCKYMDKFYATHEDILQFRADHYVLVKVNVSEENINEQFLSQFPAAAGYPHIYILDRDGTFLHSQDTAELEDGRDSYVPEVFIAFLKKWALSE